jgi:chorismate synthase
MDEKGTTATNHAGGITGGLTNGNDLLFRIAVKPASSTPQPQQTFHFKSGTMEKLEVKGRHDLVIALRVPPVLEAVTMIAVTDLLLCAKANGTV